MSDAFVYEALTDVERRDIVEGRLRQLEAEHYGNVLVRRALEKATDVSAERRAELVAQLDATIATLESAISLHRAERDRLA